MKVAICDDKEIYLRHAYDMLQTIDDIEAVAGFTKASDLLKRIEAGEKYDLILMDIFFPEEEESIIFCYKNGIEAIRKKDIIYLESEAHKILIHTLQGDRIVYDKLDSYEQRLEKTFTRVHKSYLVNMDWIYSISSKELLLKNQVKIPVSRSKYQQVKEHYFNYVRWELKGSL